MKRFLLVLCLAISVPIFNGCATAPSARQVEVHSLLAVGNTAKTAMDAATQLLKQGAITVPQWQKVADLYDNKFQPAFALAVAAARSDLSSIASPDLVGLGLQLASLVSQFSTHP